MKRVKRYEKMKSRSLFSAMEEQLFCYLKLQTLKRPSNAGGGERACESTSPSLRAHRPRRELCYFSPNAIGFCFHIASVNVFS